MADGEIVALLVMSLVSLSIYELHHPKEEVMIW